VDRAACLTQPLSSKASTPAQSDNCIRVMANDMVLKDGFAPDAQRRTLLSPGWYGTTVKFSTATYL